MFVRGVFNKLARNRLVDQSLPAMLPVLRRYALVLSRDLSTAEDLVQATLAGAYERIASLDTSRPIRPWLMTIMHHLWVSNWRSAQVEERGLAELAPLQATAAAPGQFAAVELGRALDALMSLPCDQREAIALVAIDGMSYEEAATILGVPAGTLTSRLARGREGLRRLTAAEPGGGTPDAATGRGFLRMVKS